MESKIPSLTQMLANMLESRPQTKGIYVYGHAGCGKTTIIKQLSDAIKDRRIKTYLNVPDFILEVKSCFKNNSQYDEQEVLHDYIRPYTKIVFLDDLAANKSSEFVDELMYILINRIEQRFIIPVITSNFSISQVCETMGDRISSRIAGICDIFEIKDKDYRVSRPNQFEINEHNQPVLDKCQEILNHVMTNKDILNCMEQKWHFDMTPEEKRRYSEQTEESQRECGQIQ